MRRIAYDTGVLKSLRRMSRNEAERLVAKIQQYAADPASLANNVKKLQGREGFRLRFGDWRVLFDESDEVLTVLSIGSRGSVYD